MTKEPREGLNQEAILTYLRKNLNEQRPVTLYNTYEGIPITYEAEVAMVHPGYIGLVVHPYQAVCIKLERRTYLESKFISELVRAHPVSIDYTNRVVLLRHLKIPNSITKDLYHSWVAPEKQVGVAILGGKTDLSGQLMEIAVLEQNRIRVVVSVPEDSGFKRHEKVKLSFSLNGGGKPVRVSGEVLSLVKIRNQKLKRLEVEGKAAMKDEITILAFIAKREDQIRNKLEKTYKKLRKVKKHGKRRG